MFTLPSLAQVRKIPPSAAVAALIWAVVVVLLFHRLPFGTSQGDESYYNSMPYAFAIGSRPYIDELGVFQNPGVMLTPFYRLYIAISGSGDGLILFNRYLYFVYSLACSVLAFRFATRFTKLSTALGIGALVNSFAYFNLFAISYNTTGAFGFFCGILCTGMAFTKQRPGRMLFVASLMFLSAMFGYPGLTPVVGAYFLIVLGWLLRKTTPEARASGFKGLAAAAGAALLGGGLVARAIGSREQFARLIGFTRAMGYGTQGVLARLNVFHLIFERWHWLIVGYMALFVALPLACLALLRTTRFVALALALALAAALAYLYRGGLGVFTADAASICQTALPLLAATCVLLNRRWKHASFMMWLIWAPSVMSMMVLSYTSGNSFYAACLGVLGAAVAGILSFEAYLESLIERDASYRAGYRLVFVSLLASLIVMQARSMYTGAYAEEVDLAKCDTRVHSGPSRGLKTSAALAKLLETVDRDLKDVAARWPQAKTLTVFDDFPAGYMSTRLTPRTFATWIIWGFFPTTYGREIAKENFGSPEQLPDILLSIHPNSAGRQYYQPFIRGHYKPLVRRTEFDYVILKKIDHRS
ncbi:MAG: hypothetical protein ABI548_23285 [Polyangiaceae bacterium]